MSTENAVPATVVNVLEQMSEDDRKSFLVLLKKLNQIGNDLAQLSTADQQLMRDIGARNKDLFALLNTEAKEVQTSYAASEINPSFLKTEFYLFVREHLFKEWCARGGTLEDAVLHAFQQKWLPEELKQTDVCERVYRQYQREIDQVNAFRKEIQGSDSISQDKLMAVGLAWFTTLYKLHQLIGQGIDLADS